MKAALPDVNALIALVDSDHLGHDSMQAWFHKHQKLGWATCPLTENGMVRVLSQPSYPSGQRTPVEITGVLRALKKNFAKSYNFWPDGISISDNLIFDETLIAGTRQITDIYLLGLASHHGGYLVSFDLSVNWRAVKEGTPQLVQHPG